MPRRATGSTAWRRSRGNRICGSRGFDRPIGAWLLLFPAWWGQALAEVSLGRPYPDLWYLAAVLDRRLRHARRRLHL